MQILGKVVRLLFRKLELGKKFSAGNSLVKKHLEQLHPGQNSEVLLEEYFCKKAARIAGNQTKRKIAGQSVDISYRINTDRNYFMVD